MPIFLVLCTLSGGTGAAKALGRLELRWCTTGADNTMKLSKISITVHGLVSYFYHIIRCTAYKLLARICTFMHASTSLSDISMEGHNKSQTCSKDVVITPSLKQVSHNIDVF